MRVLVAGFQHEANTFAPAVSDWAAFERGDFFPPYARGEAMLSRHTTSGMPISGFLAEAARSGWEVLGSCWAGASPSSSVTRDAFEQILSALRTDLTSAGKLDGIYLDLHGAAVCDHLDAPDAFLVAEVRRIVGPHVPVVVSVDLHANVDEPLLRHADYVVAYRTYPHVDMVETGVAAFELLNRRLRLGGRAPYAMRRIPFLIRVIAQTTLSEPAAAIYRTVARVDRATSFAAGFPAADVAHCGPTVWSYGSRADAIADAIAEQVTKARASWRPALLKPDDAVAASLKLATSSEGPVMVADVQDNPGAGADGNTTGMLHALLRAGAGRRWPGRVALGLLNDDAAASAAAEAGVGSDVDLALGSRVTTWDGTPSDPPVTRRFTVRSIADGDVLLRGPMMTGATVHAGPCACLEVDGVLVAVSSARTQMLDRVLLSMVDVEPSWMRIIVAKSAVHFRADFGAIASHVVLAEASGPMAANPGDLPWRKLRPTVSTSL